MNDFSTRPVSGMHRRRGRQSFATSTGGTRVVYLLLAGFIAILAYVITGNREVPEQTEALLSNEPSPVQSETADQKQAEQRETRPGELFNTESPIPPGETEHDEQDIVVEGVVEPYDENQTSAENGITSIIEEPANLADDSPLSPGQITQNIERAILDKDATLFEEAGQQLLAAIEQGADCPKCVNKFMDVLEDKQSALLLRVMAASLLSKLGTDEAINALLSTAVTTQSMLATEHDPAEAGALQQLNYEILSALENSPDPDKTIEPILSLLAHTSLDDLSRLDVQTEADFYAIAHQHFVNLLETSSDREALMDKLVEVYFQTSSETGKQNLLNLNFSEFYARLAITADKAGHELETNAMLSRIYDIGSPDEFVSAMRMVTENIEIAIDQYAEQTELWALVNAGRYDVEVFSSLLRDNTSSIKIKYIAISVLGVQEDSDMVITVLEESLQRENDPGLVQHMQSILQNRKQETLDPQHSDDENAA